MENLFLDDILSQPKFLSDLISAYSSSGHWKRLIGEAETMLKASGDPIIFVGMGSSNYASIPAVNQLMASGVMSWSAEAGELLYYQLSGLSKGTPIVAISQSGESIETNKVVQAIKDTCPVISITNQGDSSIAKAANINLPILAGQESSISTKTFSNSVVLARMLAERLTGGETIVFKEMSADLAKIDHFCRGLAQEISTVYDFMENRSVLHIIARGNVLSSALVGALILKEGAAIAVEAMAGGTFRHGPLEVAGKNHTALVLAPKGKTYNLLRDIALELTTYGSKVVIMTDGEIADTEGLYVLRVPDVGEALQPVAYVIPLQLLTWQMAKEQGRVPGFCELVTKVTTIE
jgi:glucosamine--fructose-6-phosphate aminotransferase (isomerizing)